MYGALWRVIPGPRWFKAFILVCFILLILWLCVEYFFPWLSEVLPFNELTIEEPTETTQGTLIPDILPGEGASE